jgi:hypothetical protein
MSHMTAYIRLLMFPVMPEPWTRNCLWESPGEINGHVMLDMEQAHSEYDEGRMMRCIPHAQDMHLCTDIRPCSPLNSADVSVEHRLCFPPVFQVGFFFELFLDTEDVGGISLRKVGRLWTDLTALNPWGHSHRCENLKSYILKTVSFPIYYKDQVPQRSAQVKAFIRDFLSVALWEIIYETHITLIICNSTVERCDYQTVEAISCNMYHFIFVF